MSSLLELAHATKRFRSGQRETTALCDVSLELDRGEWVAVYGLRRSGRTTLLRVAAGMVPLDAGEARFDGHDLAPTAGSALGVGIGYCNPSFDPTQGGTVVDHVAVALLARGAGRARARAGAEAALARAGATTCANLDPRELHADELVRAGIARALVGGPQLLLLDEPTNGVDVLERDGILTLLRSLVDDGVAVLMTVGEPVAGADRVLALDGGRLRGQAVPEQAPVLPLRPRHVEPVA
ncbi:MAG TPA: ATP-binding cassette domain-containing protein [Conexibacter sp.]|jgi:ABC-type multidrug transport system ATPase subunit|nr:ATP-binding cassette domain-containing protein [Conexibacter sp.]